MKMAMRKRYLLLLIVTVVVSALWLAFAEPDTTVKAVHSKTVASVTVKAPKQTGSADQPASTDSSEVPFTVATPPVSDTPVTPPSETTTELQAEAAQVLTAAGNNSAQVDCFNRIIQAVYGWDISETLMLHRIDTLKMYTSYCTAWGQVNLSPDPTRSPLWPLPGFRD